MSGNDAVKKLTEALERCQLAYMLVGSYSSNYYGVPRSTRDADLVIELENEKFETLSASLPEGLRLDQQSGFEMVTATRRDIILVEGSGFKLELFHLSKDAHDQQRFANRLKKPITPEWSVYLPWAEDVIIQKLRWCVGGKREKDFSDCVDVLFVQADVLDFPYIEKWCKKHGTIDVLAQAREMAEV